MILASNSKVSSFRSDEPILQDLRDTDNAKVNTNADIFISGLSQLILPGYLRGYTMSVSSVLPPSSLEDLVSIGGGDQCMISDWWILHRS